MRGGHADQIYAAVKAAIKREVRRCRVHGRRILIADFDDQFVFTCVAKVGDVGPESRESALMGDGFHTVHPDGRLQGRRMNFTLFYRGISPASFALYGKTVNSL